MGDCAALELIVEGLRNASRKILSELPGITRKIHQMAAMMVQQLAEYEWKCKLMLEDLTSNGKKYDLSRVSKWKIPNLVIKDFKTENFFLLNDLCDELKSECQKISDCMHHQISKTQVFRCKKQHCKACIRELIESNIEMCPCGVVLSMKEKTSLLKPTNFHSRKIIN